MIGILYIEGYRRVRDGEILCCWSNEGQGLEGGVRGRGCSVKEGGSSSS